MDNLPPGFPTPAQMGAIDIRKFEAEMMEQRLAVWAERDAKQDRILALLEAIAEKLGVTVPPAG